jgi:hypothetical protein
LKIYKISKEDYDADDTAAAEIISYSYTNQLDFTPKNNTNWDAEGLISYGDKLLIFSKNWADNKVDVYSIPKTSGNYNAILESSYNANGLITGAETSANEKVIYLTGYSSSAAPFYILYIASQLRCVFWVISEKYQTLFHWVIKLKP